MGEFTRPLENLSRNTTDYINMKTDEIKLRTVRGLSVAMNEMVAIVLLLSIASIVLMASAFGSVLLIGDLIGSYAAGAFIVAGFFLLLFIIVFCMRRKLFLNSFLQLFLKQFFTEDETIN